ncbi:hypothetical protein BJX62DRAFT_207826 [Aspergillus germanicus]
MALCRGPRGARGAEYEDWAWGRATLAHLVAAGGSEEQELLREVQVKTRYQDINLESSRLTFSLIQ